MVRESGGAEWSRVRMEQKLHGHRFTTDLYSQIIDLNVFAG